MIEEVKLPEISENVESGVVIATLVKAGDFVEKEQPRWSRSMLVRKTRSRWGRSS
jgi:hypothetical protein